MDMLDQARGPLQAFIQGSHMTRVVPQEESRCTNKDLKQHDGDQYKKGPTWKKSRVLSPSGHSLHSQIHAVTAEQNFLLLAKHSTT